MSRLLKPLHHMTIHVSHRQTERWVQQWWRGCSLRKLKRSKVRELGKETYAERESGTRGSLLHFLDVGGKH